MKFRYVGDKEEMKAFGFDFSGGAEVEVEDERVIRKLLGNSHFQGETIIVTDPDDGGQKEPETEGDNDPAETEPTSENVTETPADTEPAVEKVTDDDGQWPLGDAPSTKKTKGAKA